jgi:glutaredoxin
MYGVLRPEGKTERAIFVIDKNCTIRYVDVHEIDDQPDNEVLFTVLAGIEKVPVPPPVVTIASTSSTPASVAPQAPGQTMITMYCTAWCPACRRARAFFNQHGISVQEIDVARDREAAIRVRQWANGYETTPTFDINGTIVVNFNQTRLEEILGIKT